MIGTIYHDNKKLRETETAICIWNNVHSKIKNITRDKRITSL